MLSHFEKLHTWPYLQLDW